MSIDYAIIVKSQTRLEALTARFNTKAQAKFYIERQGGDFKSYVQEHEVFYRSLEKLQTKLSGVIKYKVIERDFISSFLFSAQHVILVIGQDGLVANTAKYSKGVPIVAVNPDKTRYDGVLLPFDPNDFLQGIEAVLNQQPSIKQMYFAEANLNNGQKLLAFNDLFIGAASHVSARYQISFKQQQENQSSSGVIVSTQAGSTGWLSSIFNMAYGVTSLFEQQLQHKQPTLKSQDLLFAVREPFKSVRSQIGIAAGRIKHNTQLIIESHMPNNGVIFSDGIEKDFLKFNSGSIATIGISKDQANLVMKV